MRDDPAQQAALRQTLAKALAELERLKAQVVTDQKAIADIQTAARKANVPPGWVR
jgi:predicted  nucleic acid-binding Zn-ribbon protein